QGGPLRDRFIPRLLAAPPEALLDDAGTNFDPERIQGVLRRDEKPGGHGDRSVALGVLDMAAWDAVAKLEDRPLAAVLAERDGRRDLATAHRYAQALGGYGLRWLEEPVDPLDYAAHAELAAAHPGPLATGENLFALPEVVNLLRHGGLRPDRDVLQMDPALAG